MVSPSYRNCHTETALNLFLSGHVRELLQPEPEFLPLVQAFFATNDHPRVEWVHDLAPSVRKYHASVAALHNAAQGEPKLGPKHVRAPVQLRCGPSLIYL